MSYKKLDEIDITLAEFKPETKPGDPVPTVYYSMQMETSSSDGLWFYYHSRWISSRAYLFAINVGNLSTKTSLGALPIPDSSISSSNFLISSKLSADGQMLYVAIGSEIVMWNIVTKTFIGRLMGHSMLINTFVLSADGQALFSVSQDKTIKMWDLLTYGLIGNFPRDCSEVITIAVSTDGQTLFSAENISENNVIRLWSTKTRTVIGTLTGHGLGITAMVLSADSRILCSSSQDKTIKIWDVPNRRLVGSLMMEQTANHLALSADGRILFSSPNNGVIDVWDIPKRGVIETLKELKYLSELKLSSDNRTLYVYSNINKVITSFDVSELTKPTRVPSASLDATPNAPFALQQPYGLIPISPGGSSSPVQYHGLIDAGLFNDVDEVPPFIPRGTSMLGNPYYEQASLAYIEGKAAMMMKKWQEAYIKISQARTYFKDAHAQVKINPQLFTVREKQKIEFRLSKIKEKLMPQIKAAMGNI